MTTSYAVRMNIGPKETAIIRDLAEVLYPLLPASTAPRGNKGLTFPGAAGRVGLAHHWPGNEYVKPSKTDGIVALITNALERDEQKFCPLMLEIVKTALQKKNNGALTREKVDEVNRQIARLRFKIPELHDPAFLDVLPSESGAALAEKAPELILSELRREYMAISGLEPHPRGYAFEAFLTKMFAAHRMKPRKPFRLVGEQIDGSFDLDNFLYLVEAKWQAEPIDRARLAIFGDSVGKAEWTRGLYISNSTFSPEGLEAYVKHRKVNFVCMDALDLYDILGGKVTFPDAIRAKVRHAGEEGEPFVRLRQLCPSVAFD